MALHCLWRPQAHDALALTWTLMWVARAQLCVVPVQHVQLTFQPGQVAALQLTSAHQQVRHRLQQSDHVWAICRNHGRGDGSQQGLQQPDSRHENVLQTYT